MHVFHLFMDHWMSFGDRERSDRALLAELWRVFPPQPKSPRCLLCNCAVCLVNREAAARSIRTRWLVF